MLQKMKLYEGNNCMILSLNSIFIKGKHVAEVGTIYGQIH